ncbi:hypothetical protein FB451DRAFT_1219654 [Mycena latifolia]|nr:hypothetical protein FB451DRAFT_1219654 [Mycena latifolia]
MSEIDDIFAKRPVASTSAIPAPAQPATAGSSKKRPAPETIVDPSTRAPQKRTKEDTDRFKDSRGSGPRKVFISPLESTNHLSSGRKTEEGWSIYKEDELGIGDEGGGEPRPSFLLPRLSPSPDTPLCPFDCDCCKF